MRHPLSTFAALACSTLLFASLFTSIGCTPQDASVAIAALGAVTTTAETVLPILAATGVLPGSPVSGVASHYLSAVARAEDNTLQAHAAGQPLTEPFIDSTWADVVLPPLPAGTPTAVGSSLVAVQASVQTFRHTVNPIAPSAHFVVPAHTIPLTNTDRQAVKSLRARVSVLRKKAAAL